MKKYFALPGLITVGFLLFISGTVSSEQFNVTETAESNLVVNQTRCGWLSNPTPANFWLDDKDGQWIIGTQGGRQAKGNYPPNFKKSQWVKTNGNYGYGCACVRGTFDSETKQVISVKRASARSLSTCRKDKALKEPRE